MTTIDARVRSLHEERASLTRKRRLGNITPEETTLLAGVEAHIDVLELAEDRTRAGHNASPACPCPRSYVHELTCEYYATDVRPGDPLPSSCAACSRGVVRAFHENGAPCPHAPDVPPCGVDLEDLERRIETGMCTHADYYALIAEVRRLRHVATWAWQVFAQTPSALESPAMKGMHEALKAHRDLPKGGAAQ